jgi:hypothetical protein
VKITLIKTGLAVSAIWLIYYNLKAFIVAFSLQVEETQSLFSTFMSGLSTLMLGLPLVTIIFWALYNLKPFSWLRPAAFASIIKGIIIVSFVALIVSTSVYLLQSAPYLPNVSGNQLMTFFGSMDWLPYTIAELSLLGFAYLQLSSKAKGETLSESKS